jgi:glycosyltransferase involved in cell wall biosynthesis
MNAGHTRQLSHSSLRLGRILMTVDCVGGVWRYAMDLARDLLENNVETVFAGFGPAPSSHAAREAQTIGQLHWSNAPLDWMAANERELSPVSDFLLDLAAAQNVDLLHLNVPSQAAGLVCDWPVITVSHSCAVTWFEAVRGSNVPIDWSWQKKVNLAGFLASTVVLAPSRSHAEALRRCYGIDGIDVVHNASRHMPGFGRKDDFVFAAGRWWDEGKNGHILDQAVPSSHWPIVMAGPIGGPNGQKITIRHADHRGHLSHASTMELMERAGIFVSPSSFEPFGLAALEAARSGAALVLADIPTYRELWPEAALFAAPRDPKAFADAINWLAASPARREEWGHRALQQARTYSSRRQTAAMLEIYRRALSSRRALSAAE